MDILGLLDMFQIIYIKYMSKSLEKIHCIVDHIGCLATFARQKSKQSKAFMATKQGIDVMPSSPAMHT
jgi:hypothetical protein